MNLPSNTDPKLGHENWKSRGESGLEPPLYTNGPFQSEMFLQTSREEVSFDQVTGDASRVSWPEIEYEESTRTHKITGWVLLIIIAIALLISSVDKTAVKTFVYVPLIFTHPLALLLLVLWVGPFLGWAIAELLEAYAVQWRGRIILDAYRVTIHPHLKRRSKVVSYEQIFGIGFDRKERQVVMQYHPINVFGDIDTSRTRRLSLPHTDQDEQLRAELQRRAFGKPSLTPASKLLVIVDIVKVLFVWLLAMAAVYGYYILVKIVTYLLQSQLSSDIRLLLSHLLHSI